MDYKQVYESIVKKSTLEQRKKHSGIYFESHHIIPKCLGGTNNIENRVLLSAKEHFICHRLLVKMYPDNHKLKFAFWAMCNQKGEKGGDTTRLYKVTSRNYDKCKREFLISNSKLHSGKTISKHQRELSAKRWKENNPNKKGSQNKAYGIPRSEEVKKRISNTKHSHPERNAVFIGWFVTPFGIFASVPKALQASSEYTEHQIRSRCKNPYGCITDRMAKNDPRLKEHIGKTFSMLGWGLTKKF